MTRKTSKPSTERLGKAVRDRREELRLSQEQAAELSKSVDPDRETRTFPGVSVKTWSSLELGLTERPYPHTLMVADATLGWVDGTARAHLHGTPPPEPQETVTPDWDVMAVAYLRVEVARLQLERALLQEEVAMRSVSGLRLPA